MIFASPTTPLPSHLNNLLHTCQTILEPVLPLSTYQILFNQPLSRQVILNLYPPGQGITPHIDLPHRYADGILGVSLMGSTIMLFRRGEERYDVYIPGRSIYVLSGEGRWEWEHGIEGREEDLIQEGEEVRTVVRDLRVSVTFRWMKEGGDVLGNESAGSTQTNDKTG
jgi:alkylated DNA repair dioxygenase AlkB